MAPRGRACHRIHRISVGCLSKKGSADIKALKDIEDRLMVGLQLDPYERSLYYHLARHTRAEGKESDVLSIAGLARRLGMSDPAVRASVRSMNAKGCIKVEERSKDGHLIRVFLPDEIERLPAREVAVDSIDIETIDVYTDRRRADALIKREGARCVYCLRELRSNWALDHVIPLVGGGSNSYRNVVTCCHECNSGKRERSAEDFLRDLYRRSLLAADEFNARRQAVERLKAGELRAELSRS